ncbi:hypothetical protein EDB81DRAFT_886778 [Dactylonectria macrodidyma]|uniref:Uncharacterized protein n=1 Tax=Dactylonectria macrodidyma TaxID=307937 RepID=A0A9P9ISS4_9HYPO|nr:hypothetical protein EDB81DRAFT_886778 [Dactylonectria macrodidyma]
MARDVAGLYALLGVLGVASLAIIPVILEVLTEFSYPAGSEITSTIAWAGGRLLGDCLILLGDAMKAGANFHHQQTCSANRQFGLLDVRGSLSSHSSVSRSNVSETAPPHHIQYERGRSASPKL